jgi:dTDP-4-amino-4,6-dideoxygalactose transaminase
MIPRFKPDLGGAELGALFRTEPDAVMKFEQEFARTFEARHAVAFPYGRSALWAFFKSMGMADAEIILPAYTCVVVAHAIVLSGNVPRFVDIRASDYNMNLDLLEAAINAGTRAVIATHLFGYPLDLDRFKAIIRSAEARFGHKIWVIQDCAHSFGARWHGRLVGSEGDAAFFGLNISKMITSIFGGMMTTNDDAVAERLRTWRDGQFHPARRFKSWRRRLYLLGVYAAFQERLYGWVNWLEEKTRLLDRLTKAYHLDEKIHFPPDSLDLMLPVEARVGRVQLRKYAEIVRRRQTNAGYYSEHLLAGEGFVLPPLMKGATYSHYVVRVPDRKKVMDGLRKNGCQLGQLIEYSIPHMAPYRSYAKGEEFPVSRFCSQHTINLPICADLGESQGQKIMKKLAAAGVAVKNPDSP